MGKGNNNNLLKRLFKHYRRITDKEFNDLHNVAKTPDIKRIQTILLEIVTQNPCNNKLCHSIPIIESHIKSLI